MYLFTLTPETTPQEFVNELWKGCLADNFPSVNNCDDGFNLCQYRHNNKCCAIGMFIPQDKESLVNENYGAFDQLKACYNQLPSWFNRELLYMIQRCHDRVSNAWSNHQFIREVVSTLKDFSIQTTIPEGA